MPDTPRLILHNDDTNALESQLLAAFPKADFRCCTDHSALAALVASYRPEIVYSVRFSGASAFPKGALFGADGPRWIANGGAGTDHFGIWAPDRVTVTNAAGVAADMMADYIFGVFLHFSLDLAGMRHDQTARHWDTGRMVAPLKGKTLLIIGLGHTGRAVAARAKAFGMAVVGTRARPQPTKYVDEVLAADELSKALPRADFIAIATPLIDQTRHLIGAVELAQMKPGVIIADVSRGGVMDQAALIVALKSGRVAAAALDVFEVEPLPKESPLWSQENVLVSPHCSSVHAAWQEASFEIFLQNLKRWIRGEDLHNVVDPVRGY